MYKPKEITPMDLPGYSTWPADKGNEENTTYLIMEHNNLVKIINLLCEKQGFALEENRDE